MGSLIHAFPGAGGGEAQVQSNWTENDSSDPSYIQNKPENLVQDANYVHTDNNYDSSAKNAVDSLGTASTKNVPTTGDASTTEVVMGNDSRLTDARTPVSHNHTTSDITDFPTLGTAAAKDVPSSGNASTTQVVMGDDTRLTDAREASDVYSWAKASTKPSYAANEISGLGTAATVDTTTSITQGGTGVPTAGAVWSAIDNLPEPMILKGTLGTGGTITTLPTAAADNEGFTYKVITAGTYAGQAAKVGDFFVSCKPVGASAYSWIWFPSGDESFTDTWRNIKVNGTEKLGTGISSGALDFVNGTNTTVAFDASGNKISVSVPAVSSTSAGVAPQGAAVSSQSQSTKFLREDGSWAAPSYTTNTDTTYTVATGDANGQIKVTPSSGSAYNVSVKGLGNAAYATKGTGVFEVAQSASRSTATTGDWTAMCESTQTGSPKLPVASKWWNVISLDNWASAPTNWMSQLALPTQAVNSTISDTVWFKHNDASGTNIDSSTWHSLASGAHVGDTCMKVKYTGSTTKLKINITSATSWMLSFVVTIYQNYKAQKFMISGYNNGTSYWHQPKAVLLGSTDNSTANVYFGYDSTWNLWVGFDGGSYTGLSITEVCNGYTQITDFNGLFTISNVNSLATIQSTITATKPDAATVNGLTLSLVT